MENKIYLTFDDVLIEPRFCNISSRKEVDITTKILGFKTNPIISANMDTVTGSKMAIKMAQLGSFGILHRFMSIEENVRKFEQCLNALGEPKVGVSVGVNEGLDRVTPLYQAGARIFCVDVAHGHSQQVKAQASLMKDKHPDILLIAGNIATYAAIATMNHWQEIDIYKVGIGGGGLCSTRVNTGIGVPQLSAIQEIRPYTARPIIADGGIRSPGDVVKALAAGANMVMMGSVLAGTDEAPGKSHPDDPNLKEARGMASREAQEEYHGNMSDWKTAEGISTWVKRKGPVEDVLNHYYGGLRSGMTYVNARNLKELRENTKFIQISSATLRENIPHINL